MEQGNELKLTFIETLFPLIQSFIPLNKISPLCQKNSSKIVLPLNIWNLFYFIFLLPIGYVLFYWVPKESRLLNIFLGNPGKNLHSGTNVDSKNWSKNLSLYLNIFYNYHKRGWKSMDHHLITSINK